jgi:hypothetical protein
MSKSVLDMSVSLDGFVCGPNEAPGNGLGDNGLRLHQWFYYGAETGQGGIPGRPDDVNGEPMDEIRATGAVVAGRGTVEPAGWWKGDHHDGVPIFILTRTRTPADAPSRRRATAMSSSTASVSPRPPCRPAFSTKSNSISSRRFSAKAATSSKASAPGSTSSS